MATSHAQNPPQDIVAIFHASFHPTRGNTLDWSLKAADDVQLDGVEFSALPSALHLVEHDVVHFTKNSHRGVCVFTRRQTSEQGQRGFRLSSFGILLVRSVRPRPWRHIAALKALAHEIYASLDQQARGSVREPQEDDWEPARQFFEERRAQHTDLGDAGEWRRWSEELDDENEGRSDVMDTSIHANPTLHLPHVLRLLGPSSLTLYKHVLGRRRILVYTQPPIEPASILCQVAADICFEDQIAHDTTEGSTAPHPRLKGKHKEGINVLGVVTLHDIGLLERESTTGRGWIACTTDALFLEKPQYYDLVIDMTTFLPERASRPNLQLSVRDPNGRSRRPSYRLSTVRFTWSDVKLWNELDRILQLDADTNSSTHAVAPPSLWTDAWRLYEDVCLVCAGLWTGGPWRNSRHGMQEGWAGTEEDRFLDNPVRVRTHGEGIEGRPIAVAAAGGSSRTRSYRRTTQRYLPSPWMATTPPVAIDDVTKDTYRDDDEEGEEGESAALVHERQRRTTLALLQTFHAQTRFWLSRLATLLPPQCTATSASGELRTSELGGAEGETRERDEVAVVQLAPRDVLQLELSPLSSLDAQFVEWLVEEYGVGSGMRVSVSVRRGWRDLLGLVFTVGSGSSSSSYPN